jgi:hypothetical protein
MKPRPLEPLAFFFDQIREAAREGAQEALRAQRERDPTAREPVLLDKRSLAHALNISTATVDRLCRTQRIPFVTVGDVRRFDLACVLAALRDAAPLEPKRVPRAESASLHGVKLLTK